MHLARLILALGAADCTLGFLPPSTRRNHHPPATTGRPSSPAPAGRGGGGSSLHFDFGLGGAEQVVLPDGAEESRIAFFVWFFGASGAAGIARSAFPRMYRQVRTIRSLRDEGPTLGGETVGISPLAGYPRDLSIADVEKVVGNRLTVEEIVSRYPVEGNFLSARGYLTFKAFQRANADANPLTVRAVFDTFSTSTDVVAPDKAQDMIDEYRGSVDAFRGRLLVSKMVGYSSILILLFLLGLADFIAAGHAYTGWFPEWPGGQNFPFSIFTEEGSLLKISEYWI